MLLGMLKPLFTGEICPFSGIWFSEETGKKIALSKGERFPTHNNKGVFWELKRRATLELIQKDQLATKGVQ